MAAFAAKGGQYDRPVRAVELPDQRANQCSVHQRMIDEEHYDPIGFFAETADGGLNGGKLPPLPLRVHYHTAGIKCQFSSDLFGMRAKHHARSSDSVLRLAVCFSILDDLEQVFEKSAAAKGD